MPRFFAVSPSSRCWRRALGRQRWPPSLIGRFQWLPFLWRCAACGEGPATHLIGQGRNRHSNSKQKKCIDSVRDQIFFFKSFFHDWEINWTCSAWCRIYTDVTANQVLFFCLLLFCVSIGPMRSSNRLWWFFDDTNCTTAEKFGTLSAHSLLIVSIRCRSSLRMLPRALK